MNLTYFSFLSLVIVAEDVFLMNSKDPKNPIVYGVFTTSRYRTYHFTCMDTWVAADFKEVSVTNVFKTHKIFLTFELRSQWQ